MVSFGISIDGADALAALDLMSAVDAALLDAGQTVADDAAGRAPRWTGDLAGSATVALTGEHEVTVAFTSPVAPFVHGAMGSGAGRTVPHWPPIAAITPWAEAHGIPPGALAHSIAQRGTPLVPFLSDAAEADADAVVQAVGDAIAQAIGG